MTRGGGSALLLSVMVVSVLTATTLGGVALRFDQLSSTDKIENAAKAKLAADSGLSRLRQKIEASDTVFPEARNLTKNTDLAISDINKFRPNPRDSVYSLEAETISLPRCLAVGVVSPWVHSGSYLFEGDNSLTNPSLIFYYANIVNSTPLGIVATNANRPNSDYGEELDDPVSQYTQLGQFYNPYAPSGVDQSDPAYWQIKMGGPEDELIYRPSPDGKGSYYKGLDFLYIPYLPRFVDTGVLKVYGDQASGLVRKEADTLRNDFEELVKSNNLKVWIDANVTNDLLYQFGLGDLFTDPGEENYRLTWLQPKLWNDIPETGGQAGFSSGASGPFKAANLTNAISTNNPTVWAAQSTPTKSLNAAEGGWNAEILRGSNSFGFLHPSGTPTTNFAPDASITLNFYGSLEGIRLNQPLSLLLVDKVTRKPILLANRTGRDEGIFYGAEITKIVENGSGSVALTIKLSSSTYRTPTKRGTSAYVQMQDLAAISLKIVPQIATKRSVSNLTLQADGRTATLSSPSDCPLRASSYVACPAEGDIVGLNKAGSAPVWGRVVSVSYSTDGTTLTSFALDKFIQMPKPLTGLAHTVFTDTDGTEKVAYYGGAISANEYDGGVNTISDELWFYTPSTNSWEFKGNGLPGARSGASVVAHPTSQKLYLFGGYRYEGVGTYNGTDACQDGYYIALCLYKNAPNGRVAKVMPNNLFEYNLVTGSWSEVSPKSVDAANPGGSLELRVVSHFSERSAKKGWETKALASIAANSTVTLNTSRGASTTIKLASSHAGFSKGDDILLTGTKSDDSSFTAWGRVSALAGKDSLTIKTYGFADGASVALKLLRIYSYNRTAASVGCNWSPSTDSCAVTDSSGLSVGDAVVLERYIGNPVKFRNVYSGYIAEISGNDVYFISDERKSGFDDFASATRVNNEVLREVPLGRYGAQMAMNGNLLYLWQGNQVDESLNARFSEIWQYDLSTDRWSVVEMRVQNMPPASEEMVIETFRTPTQSAVFTAANSPEVKKDKPVIWTTNGVNRTEYVWDDGKTWDILIDDEDGNTTWNHQRIAVNSRIYIERVKDGNRESFHGLVKAIDYTSNPLKVTISHNESVPGNSGLVGDSANAKVMVYYPTYRNGSALRSLRMNSTDDDTMQLMNENTSEAETLARIPIGTTIIAYKRSASFSARASHDHFFIGTIDDRSIVPVAGQPTVAKNVRFRAAGPSFLPSPMPQAYGINALTGSGTDPRTFVSVSDFRLKSHSWAPEWTFELGSSNYAWRGRVSGWETINGDRERPSPRTLGVAATSTDGRNLIIAGGSRGVFGTFWLESNAQSATDATWKSGRSSHKAEEDAPNLAGASLAILSNGDAVMFGGSTQFKWSNIGPRYLTRPTRPSGHDWDGTYTLVDKNSPTQAAQAVDQIYNQLAGSQAARSSFKYSELYDDACRYLGETGCDYQTIRNLGTLGRSDYSWQSSLVVMNPGNAFKRSGSERSLILSGPSYSSVGTNYRWDQEGYTPYVCDGASCDSSVQPFGVMTQAQEAANENTKTVMLAGFAKIPGGGAILATPAGIGRGIVSGPSVGAAKATYCSQEWTTVDGNDQYQCRSTDTNARYINWLPDSEDLLFTFNAAKMLSAADTYRVIGYYGGVMRGYIAVQRGDEVVAQEIAP